MRISILLALWIIGCGQFANGAIVFTLLPADPGEIQVGNTAIFNLFIRSEPTEINNLTGIDFAVDADDPNALLDRTAGGQFVSATSDYFPAGAIDPYRFGFPTSFVYFAGENDAGLLLGTADTLLGSLTLSTVGAKAGTYKLGLSNLLAVTGFEPIDLSPASTVSLNYILTTQAIPEPSGALLVGLGLAGVLSFKRDRRRVGSRAH